MAASQSMSECIAYNLTVCAFDCMRLCVCFLLHAGNMTHTPFAVELAPVKRDKITRDHLAALHRTVSQLMPETQNKISFSLSLSQLTSAQLELFSKLRCK